MRHQRRTLLPATAILALGLLFLVPATPQSDGTLLVGIDKVQARVPPASLVQQMRVVVELNDRWLVRLPAAAVAQLAASGVRHEVMDVAAYGDVLFLVGHITPGDLVALGEVGGVWPLDSASCLVATAVAPDRDRFPAHVSLARIGDAVPGTPTFVPASMARAVARKPLVADIRYRSPIADMVAQVDSTALATTIKSLEAFKTRYASTTACDAAGDWLFDTLAGFGLFVERDPFLFGGPAYSGNNVVATLPGRTAPSQIVIVAAHYDSYSNTPTTSAPGADDNASGTAAVVELARILSRYSFDFTVKFIGFSAEEWGLYGSRHYAQSARGAGEQIVGVVNLDMVGYTDRLPEDLDLVVNGSSEWLANTFVGAAQLYAPLPTLKVLNASMRSSDHAPFWDQGYSALCGIEDANPSNPNYHKPSDTFATINVDFEAAVARASLATVATLAQPYGLLPPPQNVRAQAHTMASALLRARSAYLTWSATPGAAGYFVYRAMTSHGPYQRVNSTPATATSFVDRFLRADATYYYVITSADTSGVEGNYSVEVSVGG
jgi:hypothetical protein